MTTLHTSRFNGNGHNHAQPVDPADQPGDVASPTASYQPAAAVELPEVEYPSDQANGHLGDGNEPDEEIAEEIETRHLHPRQERFHLYSIEVPKSWQFESYKSTPPTVFPAMEYASAAECTAAINRSFLIRDEHEGRDRKRPRHWAVCIQCNHGFSFIRVFVSDAWAPVDEYEMPPNGHTTDCCKGALRRQLKAINAVVSKASPRKGYRNWTVAGWPIRPDEVRERSERHFRMLNQPFKFIVLTDSGLILKIDVEREEATRIARQHNAMHSQPEHKAKLIQMS